MSSKSRLDDITDLADEVEFSIYESRRGRLSRSKIDEVVATLSATIDDDEAVEVLRGRVFAEMRRRKSIARHMYPFSLNADSIWLDGPSDARQIYLFLLLFSARPEARTRAPGVWPDRVFERVTARALEEWTRGTAIVFAEMATTRGSGIRAALETLAELLGVEARPNLARTARQDHGLDVIAWRRFRDRRDGIPLVLCQCTIGRSNHVAKAREISANEWSGLLAITHTSVISSISIPHVLGVDYEHWWELKTNTELILDRLRILELLGLASDALEVLQFSECLDLMVAKLPLGAKALSAQVA